MSAKEIENHIRKRFSDRSFDVQCLSRELRLAESYLREVINLNYNVCPHHLIETIRLEEAIRLLADKNIKIYTVCSKTGYANLKTFRRAFKKRTGLSPREFKEIIKRSKNIEYEIENMAERLWGFSNPAVI